MALIDRGDVFDAEIPEVGPHPVVVVSRQETIPLRSNVNVVLVTSRARDHVTEVQLSREHGLDRRSVAACDEVYTLPKRALTRRRGSLGLDRVAAVDRGLRIALGL